MKIIAQTLKGIRVLDIMRTNTRRVIARFVEGMLMFCLAGWVGAAPASEGSNIYKKACAVCHAVGVPGIPDAPKLRPRTDPEFGENWNRRLFAGREAMLRAVLNGKGAMPPKGGDASLSDAQAEAALDYMLSQMEDPQKP